MIGRGQERRVPPPFAPDRPPAHRIAPAPAAAPEPGPRHRARGPPGECPTSRSRGNDVAGAATIPSPDMLLGQRSDPASPAETKLPICKPTVQGDLVMISITLNGARRKGPRGRFTCGITPSIGKWAAPAAKEVAR